MKNILQNLIFRNYDFPVVLIFEIFLAQHFSRQKINNLATTFSKIFVIWFIVYVHVIALQTKIVYTRDSR